MSSLCGNYANCLHSLDDHGNHNGLCLECHLACGKFIAEIEHLLARHKLSTEDGIYLFLHRHGTLDDLARHLGINQLGKFLATAGPLESVPQHLRTLQAALLCLYYRDTLTTDQLVELTIEPKEVEEDGEIDCVNGENCPDKQIEPDEVVEEIDCREDNRGEDIEEPILSEVCPIEVIPAEIIPTEEPVSEEISQCQTPILQPEVARKPIDQVPITQPDCNDRRRALRLIAKIISDHKLPKKCVDFISIHLKDCKAAELDTLLGMTTCRHLALNGVIKNCYMAPPERTGRGNHREVWMIPVKSIILVCDKHQNWVTTLQAVAKLKKMYPGIVIDRNTLRKYVLKEGLCEHSTNLFGELAIPVSVLPEVPNRYQKIRANLVKNKGILKKALKPNELTPKQIFLLLDKKIPYKTVLDYLVAGVILGEKRPNRWVSTTEQYRKFLQDATSGVRGIKPEHIPICRECLSKPYSIAAAEQ